jgi:2-C-methyl-D-erythritol 2,4-cyclodiphosphate synthase
MRENIARVLNVEVGQVNVKATTEEHLGFTGDGSGMACHAVCLLENL